MKITRNWEDVPVIFDLAFASTLTGFSTERLRQLSRSGEFPARKIGSGNRAVWRVDKDEFVTWWESRKNQEVDRHVNKGPTDAPGIPLRLL